MGKLRAKQHIVLICKFQAIVSSLSHEITAVSSVNIHWVSKIKLGLFLVTSSQILSSVADGCKAWNKTSMGHFFLRCDIKMRSFTRDIFI